MLRIHRFAGASIAREGLAPVNYSYQGSILICTSSLHAVTERK